MKRNLGMSFGLSRRCVGAVLLALCAFTPASRALNTIVDNSAQPQTVTAGTSVPQAQVFTMPGYSGTISSLTLVLGGGGVSANVDLFNVSAGLPTGSGTIIGTVNASSSGSDAVTLSGGPYTLSSGASYAIELQSSGGSWDATTETGNTGDGSFGGLYYYNGSAWVLESGDYAQMSLQTSPVPEVPVTGSVMGMGALAIAVGSALRRKLRQTVSSVA